MNEITRKKKKVKEKKKKRKRKLTTFTLNGKVPSTEKQDGC